MFLRKTDSKAVSNTEGALTLHIKRIIVLCIVAVCLLGQPFDTTVFASQVQQPVSTVTRLSLSSGRVNGERVGYALRLPTLWRGYHVSADRESARPGGAILERVNFYYIPQDRTARRVFLMSIYVYDRRFWRSSMVPERIVETQDFVFASTHARNVNFTNATDQAIFNRFMQDATDLEFLASMIIIPENQTIIPNNTVTVNGRLLNARTVRDSRNRILIPVREAAEALGYRVTWLEADRAVSFARPGFYYLLTPIGGGHVPIHLSGRVYVPSIFFIQIFGANVEIDDNDNVFINLRH